MADSYKNIIQRYVILKINSGVWQSDTKIPSENQLALKFKCSRLTARDALQSLVYSGVLYSKKGSGYIVSQSNKEATLRGFALANNITKTSVKMIEGGWLKKYFNISDEGREVYLIKKYFDKEGLFATQFTILNKNIIWKIDEQTIKESITKFLALQGVAIKYSNIHIIVCKDKEIIKVGNKLGWNTKLIPMKIVTSFSENGWVEKTIRVSRPNAFKSYVTKINYL